MAQFEKVCDWPFERRILVADPHHEFDQNEAVRRGWAEIGAADYVFHLEEDFLLRECDIGKMIAILEQNPELAQVVLKRQPWNGQEIAAGGIVEQDPPEYEDRDGFARHDRIFSLNPCLIPRRVIDMGWGDGEWDFTLRCREAGYWFAFYGQKFEPPRCIHIGEARW